MDCSPPVAASVVATPLFVISIDITSAGSVDKFSIAIVTLEFESAEVPELGDKVSSFSCEVAVVFVSSPENYIPLINCAYSVPYLLKAKKNPPSHCKALQNYYNYINLPCTVAVDDADGGKSLSMSALPNSQPGGRVSSLHKAKRTVDSHTKEV